MAYHCNICDVFANSEQTLNIHYSGQKHKKRLANGNGNGTKKVPVMKKFVKAGSSSEALQSHQISTSNADTVNSPEFCTTCRVSLTSATQAQAHYTGSKHILKQKMLMDTEKKGGPKSSQVPDYFCETCQIHMTSQSQLDAHNSGHKHQQKCKLLQEMNVLNSTRKKPEKRTFENTSKQDTTPKEDPSKQNGTFCTTCQLSFTSKIQAHMHYQGSKHKRALLVLEEKKSLAQAPTASSEDDSGEPSEKKAKFLEICNTCNVKMLCLATASAHYNSLKHTKKVMLSKGSGQVSVNPKAFHQRPVNTTSRQPKTGTELKTGGHLYCSFCEIYTNSQTQMDAHRKGASHNNRVEKIASSSKPAPGSFIRKERQGKPILPHEYPVFPHFAPQKEYPVIPPLARFQNDFAPQPGVMFGSHQPANMQQAQQQYMPADANQQSTEEMNSYAYHEVY